MYRYYEGILIYRKIPFHICIPIYFLINKFTFFMQDHFQKVYVIYDIDVSNQKFIYNFFFNVKVFLYQRDQNIDIGIKHNLTLSLHWKQYSYFFMLSRFIRYGLKCEMYTLYDYLLTIKFNQAPLSLGRHTGKENFYSMTLIVCFTCTERTYDYSVQWGL